MTANVNTRRRTLGIALLTLLQTLVLIWLAVSYYAIGWFGTEIKVKTEPVDPRDLLYGDYVRLSYDISRIPAGLWKGEGDLPKRGTAVYVVLSPEPSGMMRPEAVYDKKPDAAEGQVVLKGRSAYSWEQEISVEYGVERYYVPEGTGKELEEKADNLIARMKVAPWGQARIESLENPS